jgi:hypothetical protein
MLPAALRLRLPAALVALALVPSAGCDLAVADLSASARDEWSRTYELGAAPQLELTNVNGAVEVQAGDGGAVEIRAERRARAATDEAAKELLARIEIQEERSGDGVKITTRPPRLSGFMSGQTEVSYRIRVPAGARVSVETSNGRIDLRGIRGRVDAETTNGHIEGRALGGRVEASTVNGSIELDMAAVADEGIRLGTTNGGITLRVPESARADLAANTVNGGIDVSALAGVEELERSRRQLRARLNGGGASVRMETTNGSIRVARAM